MPGNTLRQSTKILKSEVEEVVRFLLSRFGTADRPFLPVIPIGQMEIATLARTVLASKIPYHHIFQRDAKAFAVPQEALQLAVLLRKRDRRWRSLVCCDPGNLGTSKWPFCGCKSRRNKPERGLALIEISERRRGRFWLQNAAKQA